MVTSSVSLFFSYTEPLHSPPPPASVDIPWGHSGNRLHSLAIKNIQNIPVAHRDGTLDISREWREVDTSVPKCGAWGEAPSSSLWGSHSVPSSPRLHGHYLVALEGLTLHRPWVLLSPPLVLGLLPFLCCRDPGRQHPQITSWLGLTPACLQLPGPFLGGRS